MPKSETKAQRLAQFKKEQKAHTFRLKRILARCIGERKRTKNEAAIFGWNQIINQIRGQLEQEAQSSTRKKRR